ncbi:MAG: helix-turn-helix domain-containing protein [Deltaproteobacteria bacterium]|nr:helix-turn-helix domain-containing protein [Deltaproteobacteria bacterium]
MANPQPLKTVSAIRAAEILACSRSHLYALINKGEIQTIRNKNNTATRVIYESLLDFIKRHSYIPSP